jgi:cytochrome oxidase Cu insertion factor (SCO1/SenC/PrrC family)
VVLLGAVPMAAASLNPNADPIVAQAIDGTPNAVNSPAPPFSLVDQDGRQISLSSLRGKAVVLTFLDPVCTSDCPLIAQEIRQTNVLLGSSARRVKLVAVVANPLYRARPYLAAFDEQEGLDRLPNWLYLTGSLPELERVWNSFGIVVDYEPAGAMIAHSDVAYVIDPRGHTRFVLDSEPGPGSAASKSSFAVTLAGEVQQVLASP